jgi:hypothetical protein
MFNKVQLIIKDKDIHISFHIITILLHISLYLLTNLDGFFHYVPYEVIFI